MNVINANQGFKLLKQIKDLEIKPQHSAKSYLRKPFVLNAASFEPLIRIYTSGLAKSYHNLRRIKFMAARELELRVAKLETEMIQVKQKIEAVAEPAKPWWQEIYGTFANDPLYEEAMRLGRAYRESSRPKAPPHLR